MNSSFITSRPGLSVQNTYSFFFVIGNSKQPSHVKQKLSETLTCPGKGLSSFSSMEDITFDPKGVAKLLDEQNEHKTPGMDEQLCLDLYQS